MLAIGAGRNVDLPQIEVLVDAVAGRFAIGRLVGVNDDRLAIGRPVACAGERIVLCFPSFFLWCDQVDRLDVNRSISASRG